MNFFKNILCIIFISLLTIGCYKKAHLVDPNFTGGWTSTDFSHSFEIFTDVKGAYWNNEGDKIIDYVKVKNNKLKIGNRTFIINYYPQVDSVTSSNFYDYEHYSMKLDNIVYISTKRVY